MTRFSITHTHPVRVPVAVTTDTKFVEPRGKHWNLGSTSEATDNFVAFAGGAGQPSERRGFYT